MDTSAFDRLTRALAGRASRRGVIRGAAAGSVAAPAVGLFAAAAQGDGKDDKNKDKDKNRGRDDDGRCRAAGEACEGGQTCCGGLVCQQTVAGPSYRCLPEGGASTTTNVSGAQAVAPAPAEAAQTTAATTGTTNTAGFGGVTPAAFGSLPAININVECNYEAEAFQTVCLALGGVVEGGPVLTDIALPFDGVCAVTIDKTFRPPRYEEVIIRKPAPGGGDGGGGQASAGTGGTANASADGGNISIGDVNTGGNRGGDNETNVNVSADGGNANADASGGDGNVAVVGGGGGGGATEEIVRELRQVEPASLTVVLEGNVAPVGSSNTTWWVDTEQGRFPAKGPALQRQAQEPAPATGSLAVSAFACPDAAAEASGDFFGRCIDPAAPFDLTLTPVDAGGSAIGRPLNDLARTRFVDLAPGRYLLEAADGAWCRAESDAVNEAGEVVIEPDRESNVWLFTCPSQ
jgi:hypothetical protein